MGFEIPNFAEQRLVTNSLVLVAKHTSASMDKLLVWVLTAFGAGLTYLIGQARSPLSNPQALWPFLASAAVAAVVSRYFATLVSVSTTLFQKAGKVEAGAQVDIARFLQLYIASIPAIYSWAAAYGARQFMMGNLTATGKLQLRLMMLQSMFGLLTGGLLGVGLYQAW